MVAVDASLEETCVLACGGRWGRGEKKGLPGVQRPLKMQVIAHSCSVIK